MRAATLGPVKGGGVWGWGCAIPYELFTIPLAIAFGADILHYSPFKELNRWLRSSMYNSEGDFTAASVHYDLGD